MKWIPSIFVSGLLFFLNLIFFSSIVSAQGTYTCSLNGNTCGPGASSCQTGYAVPIPNPCNSLNYQDCYYIVQNNQQLTCIVETGNNGSVDVKNGPPIVGGKIETAIGMIPITDEQELAGFFLRWGMGLGGGIALILIVVSTYMIMTSAGDPRKLQAGKELLTSAVSGLILLVFSAWLLNFIGVKVLNITF